MRRHVYTDQTTRTCLDEIWTIYYIKVLKKILNILNLGYVFKHLVLIRHSSMEFLFVAQPNTETFLWEKKLKIINFVSISLTAIRADVKNLTT